MKPGARQRARLTQRAIGHLSNQPRNIDLAGCLTGLADFCDQRRIAGVSRRRRNVTLTAIREDGGGEDLLSLMESDNAGFGTDAQAGDGRCV